MKILLLTPGMVEKYNDNYHAYKYISECGNKILAITQKEHSNKGSDVQEAFSSDVNGNFIIHRVFKNLEELKSFSVRQKKYKLIKELINKFQPDLVFCEELTNMQLGIKIKKDFKIPLILRVEFAYNEKEPYRTMGNKLKYFKNMITGDFISKIIGKIIWNYACKHSAAIISCYYQDSLRKITKFKEIETYYVPWPAYIDENFHAIEKKNERGIFIGSFDEHKNLGEFNETIPKIFNDTKIKEFIVVGDGKYINVINNLEKLYPGKFIHIKSLSRDECLKLISSSFFSYSPATRGGWGFIGDSWATKTPIVVTHNHYGFHDGVDSVVTNSENIIARINELYNTEIYNKISEGGFKKFDTEHTANSVGKKYIEICKKVVNY